MERKFIDVVFDRCKTLAETRIILALAGVYGIGSKKHLAEVTQLAKANLYNALNTLISNGDIVYNGIYSLNETIYPHHTTQGIETIPTPAIQGIETIHSVDSECIETIHSADSECIETIHSADECTIEKKIPSHEEMITIYRNLRFSPITLQRCYNGYLRSKKFRSFAEYAKANRHKYIMPYSLPKRESKREMALQWLETFGKD